MSIKFSENRIPSVLVVDDEPDNALYLTTLLEDSGYATRTASDADAALTLLRRQMTDLICLDVMMPRRSGIALYKQIKQDKALCETPVIFISAFGRSRDFKGSRFQRLVNDKSIPEPAAFLEKPIEVGPFLNTVSTVLGRGAKENQV